MFHIGQQVVCLETFAGPRALRVAKSQPPQRGRVYTVRDVIQCKINGKLGLRLEEVLATVNHKQQTEHAWEAQYFRPVRKTDISIFTSMLAPTPKEKVNENA